jgi:hypothetical protein
MFIIYFLEYSVYTGLSERENFFKYVDIVGLFMKKLNMKLFYHFIKQVLFYQDQVFLFSKI